MSDVGSDFEAAVVLVDEAQDRLIEKLGGEAKNSDLLSHLFLKFNTDKEYAFQALLRRFSRDLTQKGNVIGVMDLTYALTQYLTALEVALGERPADTSASSGNVDELPPSKFDDEFPF